MAVFVAASDESSAGRVQDGEFVHGGFLAPVLDWTNIFAPLWEARVLKGPPPIPYLHMTEIRSRPWREKYGLDRGEAEFRVDEAFGVINAIPSLTPIAFRFNAGPFLGRMKQKIRFNNKVVRRFDPDYFAFVAYAFTVIEYVHAKRPTAEKVDFIVEEKAAIKAYMLEFYREIEKAFIAFEKPYLVPLIGQLIPAGKERVPVQAADLLCWYSRRRKEGTLDARELKRYSKIATRNGVNVTWPNELLDQFCDACAKGIQDEENISGIPELQRNDEAVSEGSARTDKGDTGSGESSKKAEA